MAGLINNWLDAATQGQTNDKEAAWLKAKRELAAKQLTKLQEPNRKLESWRYADAGRLNQAIKKVEVGVDLVGGTADEQTTDIVLRIHEHGFELLTACPKTIQVESMVNLSEAQWRDIEFDQETVVNLANTMLFNDGVSIQINDTAASYKIIIEYNFKNSNEWQYLRNQINLTGNSQVSIEERFVSGRINVVNLYQVNDSAKLQRKQNIYLDETQQFISFNQFDVAENAEIINMNHHHGGSLQHHVHRVNFNATGAKYTSGAINKSFDNNNITDIVIVNHWFPNNQSDVTHRSIAKDHSQIFNNARAMVAPSADQSEIEQDLKNILLSPDAKIFSKPELEVYADEVVAAHGSTIGALDDIALFYLQSRGVDIEQARDIMIESFEQEAMVC